MLFSWTMSIAEFILVIEIKIIKINKLLWIWNWLFISSKVLWVRLSYIVIKIRMTWVFISLGITLNLFTDPCDQIMRPKVCTLHHYECWIDNTTCCYPTTVMYFNSSEIITFTSHDLLEKEEKRIPQRILLAHSACDQIVT